MIILRVLKVINYFCRGDGTGNAIYERMSQSN